MADINNDIWIDVETLAKLKNITRRAVRLALNQNKYEYKVENIRGGKTYKIKLSTLEEELQLKYFQEYYDDYKTCDNEVIELSNLNIKQEKLISENQRKIALAKYDLIYAWLDFRKEYKRDKLKASPIKNSCNYIIQECSKKRFLKSWAKSQSAHFIVGGPY